MQNKFFLFDRPQSFATMFFPSLVNSLIISVEAKRLQILTLFRPFNECVRFVCSKINVRHIFSHPIKLKARDREHRARVQCSMLILLIVRCKNSHFCRTVKPVAAHSIAKWEQVWHGVAFDERDNRQQICW